MRWPRRRHDATAADSLRGDPADAVAWRSVLTAVLAVRRGDRTELFRALTDLSNDPAAKERADSYALMALNEYLIRRGSPVSDVELNAEVDAALHRIGPVQDEDLAALSSESTTFDAAVGGAAPMLALLVLGTSLQDPERFLADVRERQAELLARYGPDLHSLGVVGPGALPAVDATTRRADAASVNLSIARGASRLGLVDGAVDALERAATLGPPQLAARAAIEAARLKQEQGDHDGAIASLRFAAELDDPEHAALAMNNLGVALGDQGRYEEARAAYQRAIASAPSEDSTMARYNLAVLLMNTGDRSAARHAAQQAVEHGSPAVIARASNLLARVLGDERDTDGLQTAYDQAAERRDTERMALFASSLGVAFDDLGRELEAVPHYENVLAAGQSAERIAHATLRLGRICDQNGQLEQALGRYERVSRMDLPAYAEPATALVATALQRLGRIDEARSAYRRAAQASNPEIARAAEQQLLRLGS